MRRAIAFGLLLLAACHNPRSAMRFAPSAPIAARDPERRARILAALPEIESFHQKMYEGRKMPSLVAGVLVDGELVWTHTWGKRDLDKGGDLDTHTYYRIGSITKVFTAMAVLKLRDEGKLSLDDPAAKHLRELEQVLYPSRDSMPITVRQMLTHTSGLPRLGNYDYAKLRSEGVPESDVVGSLAGLTLPRAPGSGAEYSNFGFGLLGIMVGRVAGEPYRDYMTRAIFQPLGMQSQWDYQAIPEAQRATGYDFVDGQYRKSHEWLMGASEGMGGIYATLDDMARFVAFHMTAWPPDGRPDREPLGNASLRESQLMGGFQPPGRRGTGLGWGVVDFVDLDNGAFHTGATATFAATAMFMIHEGIGYVALTNCGQLSDAVDALGSGTLILLAKRAKGEPPPKTPSK